MLAVFDNPQGNYVAAAYAVAAAVILGLALVTYISFRRAQASLQRLKNSSSIKAP